MINLENMRFQLLKSLYFHNKSDTILNTSVGRSKFYLMRDLTVSLGFVVNFLSKLKNEN